MTERRLGSISPKQEEGPVRGDFRSSLRDKG